MTDNPTKMPIKIATTAKGLLCSLCLGVGITSLCLAQEELHRDAAADQERQRWSGSSADGALTIVIAPRSGSASIGKFQVWDLWLTDADGQNVFPARFAIGGGMQGHGHGLPTQPRVTAFLPDGRYVIEGLRFNMAGEWSLFFSIQVETSDEHQLQTKQIQVDIKVDY